MNKKIEWLYYTLFGNCANIGHNKALQFIANRIPKEFYNHDIVDLGCGDGVNTLKLAKIFEAKSIIGYDIVPSLIKRAQRRGVNAYVKDIEKEPVLGKLGILWGVLHHFSSPKDILIKLKEGFDYLFIREKTSSVIFELGKPFRKEQFITLAKEVFGETICIEYSTKSEEIVFIFFAKYKL